MDESAEERKGGAGHLGKMLLSAGRLRLGRCVQLRRSNSTQEKSCLDHWGPAKQCGSASACCELMPSASRPSSACLLQIAH